LKILHLLYESKGDYFGIGGVGIRAYEIYRRLKDRHDITLLCKKYPGAADGTLEGLRHIFVGTESKSLAKTLLSYAYSASLFTKKYGDEFDIIIGLLCAFERFRPLFYRNIVFVSAITAKRYRFRAREKNIKVIPNGIREELLTCEPGGADYMLYLGRIDVHGKGLDILLHAYGEFHNSFPHIRLVIAGDGRDREKFAGMLRRLPDRIKKNIELRGWVDGEEKMDLLKDALLVVMPSRHETQGIVALEALACGKAVIVSDIPELSYVTGNQAGISCKTGDAFSLAEAMRDLITREERREMGQRGRDWVARYTWGKIALEYEGFLMRVLEQIN
jgi:glycosyltransferase involved in cell wall biosynthesis